MPLAPSLHSPFGLCFFNETGNKIPLPLKAIDARFQVQGDCAEIVMEQVFEHTGLKAIDVLYTFPLPADAVVHRCDMRIGKKIISAKVKPEAEARKEYKKQKAAGRRVALVETVRDNLFELTLGNVQPGDHPVIQIAMVLPLTQAGTKERRLRIPSCPGIRYIPGMPTGGDGATDLVPDAGRLNPARIAAHDPEAALFFCAGTVQGGRSITSPTHRIDCVEQAEQNLVAIMLDEESAVPDRDFVLLWEPTATPLALCNQADPSYLLCSVHAPSDLPEARSARDIFFLLDGSGSMDGKKRRSLHTAFELALGEVAAQDRIAVAIFNDSLVHLTQGLVSASSAKEENILQVLKNRKATGGTEFTKAFSQTVTAAKSANRPVILVITDGEFGDEQRAATVAAAAGIEVHLIGIDTTVNETALQAIARRTRGSCTLCVPGEELTSTVESLMQKLLSSAVEKITASDGWQLAGPVPAIRRGEAGLVPFHRISHPQENNPSSSVTLTLQFSDHSNRVVTLPIQSVASRAPLLLAVKAEITACLDQGQKQEAVSLACQHNILCEGASFLAYDEAEKVPVAKAVLEQASIEPAGWGSGLGGIVGAVSGVGHGFLPPMDMLFCEMEEAFDCDKVQPFMGKIANLLMPSKKKRTVQSQEFYPLAEVLIFSDGEFSQFATEVLIPWAKQKAAHKALLEKVLRDLIALGAEPKNLLSAITILLELRAFASPKIGKKIEVFCEKYKGLIP